MSHWTIKAEGCLTYDLHICTICWSGAPFFYRNLCELHRPIGRDDMLLLRLLPFPFIVKRANEISRCPFLPRTSTSRKALALTHYISYYFFFFFPQCMHTKNTLSHGCHIASRPAGVLAFSSDATLPGTCTVQPPLPGSHMGAEISMLHRCRKKKWHVSTNHTC